MSRYGIRDPYRHQNVITCSLAIWPIANLPCKFHAKPFESFCAKLLTNRQTDKETNNSNPHWQCIVGLRWRPYSASSNRRHHCVAARGWRATLVGKSVCAVYSTVSNLLIRWIIRHLVKASKPRVSLRNIFSNSHCLFGYMHGARYTYRNKLTMAQLSDSYTERHGEMVSIKVDGIR